MRKMKEEERRRERWRRKKEKERRIAGSNGGRLAGERFMANPAQTSLEIRVKLSMVNVLSAEIFALIVFLCDDLL